MNILQPNSPIGSTIDGAAEPTVDALAAAESDPSIPVKRGIEFLNVPGPTNIPRRILNAMNRPAIDFSGPEFITLSRQVFEDLKPIFQTEGEVFIYAANGHGAWEAALVNVLNPGDTILVPETGNFSNAWAAMATALSLKVEMIPNDWRRGIDANKVEDILRKDGEGRIKAVAMVHTDTATGITSDIQSVRGAIDATGHDALFIVDAIASLATTDLQMDNWGVDVTLAASQKGFMAPPGVALVAAGQKALDRHTQTTMPRRYWDWTERNAPQHYRRFCGTAPEHVIFGIQEAIQMLNEETLEGTFARHARLAEGVRRCVAKWCEGGALEFNALVAEERANAVTTILLPENMDTEMVRGMCRDHFQISLGGGLGDLMGKAFRIGHMGDNNEAMILGCLGGVEASLKRLGTPIESGIEAAVDWFAETGHPL